MFLIVFNCILLINIFMIFSSLG